MDTTVLVALVGAGGVICGGGLTVLGGYVTTRANRETVERQIEADAVERDRERRFTVEVANRQAFRDVRRAAHEEALRALKALHLQLGHETLYLRAGMEPTQPRAGQFEHAAGAVSRVAFIASEPVREACKAVIAPLYAIDWENDLFRVGQAGQDEHLAVKNRSEAEFTTAFALYEDAARRELGLHT